MMSEMPLAMPAAFCIIKFLAVHRALKEPKDPVNDLEIIHAALLFLDIKKAPLSGAWLC
jgi:hypothetical protein